MFDRIHSVGKPLFCGLLAVGGSLFLISCLNWFASFPLNYALRIIGMLVLSPVVVTLVYNFVPRGSQKNTWTFNLVFFPLYLISLVDLALTIDFFSEPNYWLVSEYLKIDDGNVHSNWGKIGTVMDGTLGQFINQIVLLQIWNGVNWRSLMIFNAAVLSTMFLVFLVMTVSCSGPVGLVSFLYLFVTPWGVITPIVPMYMKKSFKLDSTKSTTVIKILEPTAAVLTTMTMVIMVGKACVSLGYSNWALDVVRENDPILLFVEEKQKTLTGFPIGAIQSCIYLALMVPSLAVNLSYKFWITQPSFLWDFALVQFGTIVQYQSYFIFSALPLPLIETPSEYQVDIYNYTFWAINGLPVISSILELLYLSQYKTTNDENAKEKNARIHSSKKVR